MPVGFYYFHGIVLGSFGACVDAIQLHTFFSVVVLSFTFALYFAIPHPFGWLNLRPDIRICHSAKQCIGIALNGNGREKSICQKWLAPKKFQTIKKN